MAQLISSTSLWEETVEYWNLQLSEQEHNLINTPADRILFDLQPVSVLGKALSFHAFEAKGSIDYFHCSVFISNHEYFFGERKFYLLIAANSDTLFSKETSFNNYKDSFIHAGLSLLVYVFRVHVTTWKHFFCKMTNALANFACLYEMVITHNLDQESLVLCNVGQSLVNMANIW